MTITIIIVVIVILYGIGKYQAMYGAMNETRKLRNDLKQRDQRDKKA